MSLISVSIVTFNTWNDTERCVEAVLNSVLPEGCDLEVLVHDNGHEPPPAPSKMLTGPTVRITRSATNLGFGSGHNSNLAIARGDYFFVLNPDTRPDASTIRVLAERLAGNESFGAVAPQLRDEGGAIQPSCRRLPRLRYEVYRAFGLDRLSFYPFSEPLMKGWRHDSERVVEQPAGAALMLRTADLRRLGGFCEDFPIYFEDVDLCRRVSHSRGPILFTPRARVLHRREGAARRYRKETTFWLEWSRGIYYEKLGVAPATKLAVRLLTLSTALVRMILLFIRGALGPSGPDTDDARAKALGYGLVLTTLIFRDEGRWRRALLHR